MADLRSRIAALSPAQRALLESRVAELMAAGATGRTRIRPRDRSRPTPLGIAQQREWAISRLRGANNVPGAFRVDGPLDLKLLSRALTELLDRHEVLRSTVEIGADGVPVQVVHPTTTVPVPVVDISGVPPERQPERVRAVCRAEILRPFDPAATQRLRMRLIRLAPDAHVCLLITDHAASDAWSLAILIQEIATLYAAYGSGGPGLPRPELQFGDFAAWQREQVGAGHADAELRHWRQTLAGIPATMALPADRPWPARTTYAGDVHTVDVPADLVAAVRRFSERENASLFPILLTACSVLLHRHLDQDDLVIGSLVSGRTRVETEGLVGCFANPLPLRMRMADDLTLREVVRQARDTLATALDHQDVPFDRLIEELGLARESAQTSLSRMWINVITVPIRTLDLPGLRFSPAPLDLGLASVDLTLSAIPEGERLRLQWQYMTELFDAGTVALLADQFQTVLRQVVTDPDLVVDDVVLDAAPEASPEPPGADPVARQAGLTPYATAVAGDGFSIAYAELDRDADRLADRLRAARDGSAPVGVPVDTPRDLAVAAAALLKAGLTAACEKEGPLVIATAITRGPSFRPAAPGGSSGTVSARELADRLGLGAGDRFLAVLPPGAVLPAAGMVATWLAGGTVVVPSWAGETPRAAGVGSSGSGEGLRAAGVGSSRSGETLQAAVERHRVTVLQLPTDTWRAWLDDLGDPAGLPRGLRLVVVTGEERPAPEELAAWERLAVPVTYTEVTGLRYP